MPQRSAFSRIQWILTVGLIAVLGVIAVWIHVGRAAEVSGRTAGERVASIARVADRKPRGAAAAIAAAAADPQPRVRLAAQAALGRFADPACRGTVETGLADSDAGVRSAAAAALGYYQDEAAADHLGKVLSADAAYKVRIGAVLGLGRNKTSKTIVWLLEAAEADGNAEVQFLAIKELYRKFGMRYIGPEPAKAVKWKWKDQVAVVVEYLKGYPQVQEAFRRASRPLVRRPQDRYVPKCERGGPVRSPDRTQRGDSP